MDHPARTSHRALEHLDRFFIASATQWEESKSRTRLRLSFPSRRVGGRTYFLSCRDAAKAFPGLSHQTAYNINVVLAQLGVIEVVRVGDARPNGRASQFRYLLPRTENGAP